MCFTCRSPQTLALIEILKMSIFRRKYRVEIIIEQQISALDTLVEKIGLE